MTSFDPHGAALLCRIISIISQTLLYGIYLCLLPISIYVLITNGLKTRSRKWLLAMTTTMFALSTIFWISSVLDTFLVITAWFSNLDPATHNPPSWLPMFNAVLMVNYIFTDGVVVWRAWVLCADESKVVLVFPIAILAINTVFFLMTVVARVGLLLTPEGVPIHRDLARMIDISQVATLTLSLLTNILATSIIAAKAWKYRKLLVESGLGIQTPTQAIRVLGLLVESGMLFIFIGVAAVASVVIRLPIGTLGDMFIPVSVQLVGMYPIIVLLLVEKNRSLSSTYYSSRNGGTGTILVDTSPGRRRSQMEPMSVSRGPVLPPSCSQTETDSATRPPTINIHFSFGSPLEPRDPEMNAGSSKAS